MSEIFEAIKKNNIVISVPNHGFRLAVEVFPYKDGAVFFDVGWTISSGHPFHIIPGPIVGNDEYWEFGDIVRGGDWQAWIYDPKTDSELKGNNDTWAEYLKSDEGKKYANRERALEVFKENFK